MLIGEVSKEYGIGIETLRYYDRIGLLTIERRKNNRHYTEKDIKKLQNIMAMKEMMFTLEDIKKLLEIDERIDRGLENRTIDNKDINTLLEGVKSKHLEILEKEKQLKKVKMHLEKIIGKIENLQRRNNSD
ncbi:MerR HTH family regulatory protein [Proteiniborus ethanoligenes]|uniref:MerR HTH family regulatory protein n=1 Tax=Proteiniborus ethanoligenes TaxID=415015 RepID=A0A1H3MW36_9FIRM|nr:MerR family transcriptional regulator [Proteiniborus ethanoligenes]TAH61451.1 MAG: MerR family transcriptional regulator [Gottschalkiaceae bacterium]SDY80670.1 MerR HTH family regulatory protein [Proteiniborus ethanoligenes]